MIRIVVATSPLDESVVGRSRGQRVIDRLGAQLCQLGEAAGPSEGDLPAVRIAPIISAFAAPKEVQLIPLHVISVRADKTYGTALIRPINRSRVERRYFRLISSFSTDHQ